VEGVRRRKGSRLDVASKGVGECLRMQEWVFWSYLESVSGDGCEGEVSSHGHSL
jgi:hypothetical protein